MSSRKIQFAIQLYSAALVFFLAIGSDTAWAQGTAAAPLPPAAQEALDKGIIAAKVPDYLLAIRFFEEARKIAPAAPIIYLNLGLAESRIPSRELRAIAWFGAYLAAYPDAQNAVAVREQIAVLDVRNQSNISRLIKSVQDASNQMLMARKQSRASRLLKEQQDSFNRDDADSGLDVVAALWANAGDIAAAFRTADLIQGEIFKDSAKSEIATTQAEVGDSAGALKTADRIQDVNRKSGAQMAIAAVQLKAGDIAGAKTTLVSALKTADLILEAGYKSSVQKDIAQVCAALKIQQRPVILVAACM